MATGDPPLATTKGVMATAVATGRAAVATGWLPWVVSTGNFKLQFTTALLYFAFESYLFLLPIVCIYCLIHFRLITFDLVF